MADAVIYELHVGTFSDEGTFRGVRFPVAKIFRLVPPTSTTSTLGRRRCTLPLFFTPSAMVLLLPSDIKLWSVRPAINFDVSEPFRVQ